MAVQDSQISEGSAATSIDGEKTHVVDIHAEVAPESFTTEEEKQAFLATFTAEDDKAIMKKVDRKFLLLIGLMYMVKNIDYLNAASVKVLQVGAPTNVMTQLGMTSDQYNWVQSIYFISYIVFEVPSNLLLKRMTPRLWQSRIFFSWGAILACHGAVKNKEGLYAARFFLGMAEAGFFPGIVAQLSSWYRSDEMGKPIMWMFGWQACSGIVGSLLAYGISYMNGVGGLSAWQWVYILEGIATMLFSSIIFFVLPDYPRSERTSKWLTLREQAYIEARLSENAPKTTDAVFDWSEIVRSVKDLHLWTFMAQQTLINLGGYGLSWYLPTITTNLGFAGLPRNQLLNIPPAALTVLSIIFAGWFLSKGWLTRPAFVMPIMAGMIAMFVCFFTVSNKGGIYAACILGTAFYSVYFIPFWAWRSSTLKGTTGSAFVLAFQSCVAQSGGVIGPQLFRSKWAYNGYKVSFGICAGAIILALFFNLATWYLTRNVEWDVLRVQRLRIAEKKKGLVYAGDDVKVYEERNFYEGLGKRKGDEAV